MSDNQQIIFDTVSQMECPSCHTQIDVSALPAFTKANCPNCGAEVTVPARLGNYTLLSRLGAGGMGAVYRAHDDTLARIVAIKVMLKSLGDQPEFLASFRREAQAAAKLNHPNICQIYSFGEEKGQPYIVMELVGGKHFDEMIAEEEPLDQAMVMKIGMDIADGLQLAAASNLIHGDIKPENILLDERGVAKLLDFGIASAPNRGDGEIWGTPYYIAPEKLRRQRVDFRSDIYCLGGTLYHALTKHPPFDGEDAMAVVKARLQGPPVPMKTYREDLDQEVCDIIDRMLQMEPAMRYPTYGSLLSDMRRFLSRVSPKTSAASNAPSKRIIIKGRGRGAGSKTPSSSDSTGAFSATGHHGGIVISRGTVDSTTHNLTGAQGDAATPTVDAESEEKNTSKGSKVFKGCAIGCLSIFLLLAVAGGGAAFFLVSKAKGALGELHAEANKLTHVSAAFEKSLANAVHLRDNVMPTYAARAEGVVSQAIAAVEAELGTEFTDRIRYEAPAAEDMPDFVEGEKAAEAPAEKDEAASEGEGSGNAETPPEGETATETSAEEAAKEETKAEGAAEAPAEGEGAETPAEGEAAEPPAEEGAAEAGAAGAPEEGAEANATSAEPELEGLPLMAREVFLALRPVREASHATVRTCGAIEQMRADVAALTNNIPSGGDQPKVFGVSDAIREAIDQVKGRIAEAEAKAKEADELAVALSDQVNASPAALRDAEGKLRKLLEETGKLKAAREAAAAEEAARRAAEEAAAKKAAEEERIRLAKAAEIAKIQATGIAHLSEIMQHKYDGAKKALQGLEKEFVYPESKKALKLAIQRVDSMQDLEDFLVKHLSDDAAAGRPFKHPQQGWSVQKATKRNITVLRNGKTTTVPWEKVGMNQMVPFIRHYLENPEYTKELKLRERCNQRINAAIYISTLYGQQSEGARKLAIKFARDAYAAEGGLPAMEAEIMALLPELNLDGPSAPAAVEE